MIASYLQDMRLLNQDVRRFLVTATLVGFSWDGSRAVLLNLYMLRLGYGPEFVGIVNAAGSLAFAISCLPAGALGTRWGSRRMLVIAASLLAAGLGLLPLVEFLPGGIRSPWLVVTNMLAYTGLATYFVNSLPFLMDATGPRERNHAFAAQIALTPLAGFAGSLVGGALPGVLATLLGVSVQDPAVYRYPLLLSALLLVPGVLVLLPTRRERSQLRLGVQQAPAPTEAGGRAPVLIIFLIALVVGLRFASRGSVGTFFNVYMDAELGASTALIGVLWAAGQLLSVPAALAAPPLAARWGNGRTVLWGTWGMAVSLLPLALVPHWTAAGLGALSSTFMLTLSTGPIRVYSQEIVTPRWRATMSGALMMGSGLAFSLVAFVGGFAIAAAGYRVVFLAAAVLSAIGALIFWAYFRVPRGELAKAAASEAAS